MAADQSKSYIVSIMYLTIAVILLYLIYSFGFSMIRSATTVEHFALPRRRSYSYLNKIVESNRNMILLLNNKLNQTANDVASISQNFFKMNREIVNTFYNSGRILFDEEKLLKNKKKLKASILNSLKYDPKKNEANNNENEDDNEDDANDEVTYRRFKILTFVFDKKVRFQTSDENKELKEASITNSIKIINNEMKHFFAIPMDHTEKKVTNLYDKLNKMNEYTIVDKLKSVRNQFVSYDKKKDEITLKSDVKQKWLLMFPEDVIYGDSVEYTIEMHLGTLVEIVEESMDDEEDENEEVA